MKRNCSDNSQIIDAQIVVHPDGETEIVNIQPHETGAVMNPSQLNIFQIQPNVWGVFLRKNLLKKFRTKIGAELYLRELRAKMNPSEPDGAATEKVVTYFRKPRFARGRAWLEEHLGQQRLFNYNPSGLYLESLKNGKYGVFFNAQLLKQFTSKASAAKYLASLKAKALKLQKNPDEEIEFYNFDDDTPDVIFADNADDVIFLDDAELPGMFEDVGLEDAELIENGFGSWLKDGASRRVNRFRAGRALKQQLKYEDRASRAKARLSELTKNPAWLGNLTNGLVSLASAAQIREHLQKQKRKAKPAPKTTAKKNPHGDIFKEFTGREATTTTEMPVSHLAPQKLDKLGDLVEIRLTDGRKLQFNPQARKNKVWLTAANRRKMWIVGTRIAKPNPNLKDHEIEEIGEIDKVVYHEFKPIVGDAKPEFYIHELGEWSGNKPILAADKDGMPVIHGGNYSVESRGIVD